MPGSHGLRILDDEKYLWCVVDTMADIISRESTAYKKKKKPSIARIPLTFLFCIPTPSYSDADSCSLSYGFSYLKIQP